MWSIMDKNMYYLDKKRYYLLPSHQDGGSGLMITKDQGYGRRVTPFFSTAYEQLGQVTFEETGLSHMVNAVRR